MKMGQRLQTAFTATCFKQLKPPQQQLTHTLILLKLLGRFTWLSRSCVTMDVPLSAGYPSFIWGCDTVSDAATAIECSVGTNPHVASAQNVGFAGRWVHVPGSWTVWRWRHSTHKRKHTRIRTAIINDRLTCSSLLLAASTALWTTSTHGSARFASRTWPPCYFYHPLYIN